MAERFILEPVSLGDAYIDRLCELVSEVRAGDALAPVTVVTPSFVSSFYLRRVCAGGGLFNVEFMRIDDMADQLAGPELAGQPLSRLAAAQIVSAATRVLPESSSLARAKDHPAFHQALHRTLDDLQLLGKSGLSALPGALAHGPDLAAVAADYSQRTKGFYDRSDVGRMAAANVRSGLSPFTRFGQVIVLLVDLPAPQYRPLYQAIFKTAGVLTLRGLTDEAVPDGELAAFAGSSVAPRIEIGPAIVANTTLVSAPDRVAEVRWVIGNIVQQARNGVKFGEMAVFYSDSSYGQRVEESLRIAGLPSSGREVRPLAASPAGRFISGLLALLSSDYSRDALTAWLTSATVSSPDKQRPVPGSRWDAISRSAGVVKGIEGPAGWDRRLSRYIRANYARSEKLLSRGDGADDADARRAKANAETAEELLDFIRQLSDALSQPLSAGWTGHTDWLVGVIKRFMLVPADGAESGLGSIEKLLGRISELDALGTVGPVLSQQFERVLTQELERPQGQTHNLGRGVFVGSMNEATGTSFRVVYILGMVESSFPSGDNPDPLLPDSARQVLDPGGAFLPRREQRRTRQLRQFKAACAAGQQLFLVRPRAQPGAARESGPAQWYIEVARKLYERPGGQRLSASRLDEQCRSDGYSWFRWVGGQDLFQLERHGETHERRQPPADLHEYDLDSVARWKSSGRPVIEHPLAVSGNGPLRRGLVTDAYRSGETWSEWDGNLTVRFGPEKRASTAATVASATSYQQWAICPFRYLLGRVLEVMPTERPEEQLELDQLQRGTLVHEVLDRHVRARESDGPTLDLAVEAARLERAAASAFQESESSGQIGSPALWEIDKRRLLRQLKRWLRSDLNFRAENGVSASLSEMAFGMPGSDIPHAIVDLKDGTYVQFRGKIDRLDISADGSHMWIFDYKSGSTDDYAHLKSAPNGVDRGRLLQLPIYANAARKATKYAGIASRTAAYWFVLRPDSEEFIPRLGEFSEAGSAESLKDAVATISQGISTGVFPARPGELRSDGKRSSYENCKYCEFDRVCPSRRAQLWQRKHTAAPLSRYVALAEPPETEPPSILITAKKR